MARNTLWAGTAVERPFVVAVYLGFAHLALIGLGLAIALRPDALGATDAHPLAVAMTHGLTLGWISASILGSLYMVLPLALAARLTVHAPDLAMAVGFALGAMGVIATTAIGRTDLIVWPGALCAATFAWVGTRALRALVGSRCPRPITAHIALAFVSVLLAAALALAWGAGWLTVPRARFVTAHAHLAALGFAVTMAVGIGHRLLPMFLPAAPRRERLMWTTLFVPIGTLAFALASLIAPRLALVAVVLLGGGLAAFFVGVVRLLRDQRPPPRDLVRPDPGKVQILLAVASLLAAASLGIAMAASDAPAAPRLSLVYAVLGLFGFLGQLIVGIGARLFPTFLWAHAWRVEAETGAPPTVSPVRMSSRPLLWVGVGGFAGAVAALSSTVGTAHLAWIRSGGVSLVLAGTALLANLASCWRRAGSRQSSP